MTDEEKKAEEYADKMLSDPNYPFIFSKEEVKACIIKVYSDSLKCCENAYNKGLAEGKPKWRDLRKNPGDLPKNTGEYWCKWNDGAYCTEHYFGECFGDYVIAWCEIPKFEEKK